MKPHRIHILIQVAVSILFWHEVAVADNWPSGTVLTYTYFPANEPPSAGAEVRAAAGAWDAAANCYTFMESGGVGSICWMTNADAWKNVASDSPAGVTQTDCSSHFIHAEGPGPAHGSICDLRPLGPFLPGGTGAGNAGERHRSHGEGPKVSLVEMENSRRRDNIEV